MRIIRGTFTCIFCRNLMINYILFFVDIQSMYPNRLWQGIILLCMWVWWQLYLRLSKELDSLPLLLLFVSNLVILFMHTASFYLLYMFSFWEKYFLMLLSASLDNLKIDIYKWKMSKFTKNYREKNYIILSIFFSRSCHTPKQKLVMWKLI